MNTWIAQNKLLWAWWLMGRPVPPPHIVKQRILKRYASKYELSIFVETGTCRGAMVFAMKKYFDRIYSIELSEEFYLAAKRWFKNDEFIELIHGDSGIELGRVINLIDQPALFWLDGHYSGGETARGTKDTPVIEELEHIYNSKLASQHVVLIDDARCFGKDKGYPSILEIKNLVRSKIPNAVITVNNDAIHIISQ